MNVAKSDPDWKERMWQAEDPDPDKEKRRLPIHFFGLITPLLIYPDGSITYEPLNTRGLYL